MINKYIKYAFFFASISVPVIVTLRNVLSGGMPFWYDPARDLLSALSNLSDPTLIGPTSGIPGIFYGPYWIWVLSLALLVSKDPRIVNLLVQAIPYFVVFSFLLYKLSSVWGKTSSLILWVLFIFGFMEYLTYPWNPHLAPLFAISAIYLIAITSLEMITKKTMAGMFGAGVLSGLVINFHISFGLGFTIGTLLFFILYVLNRIIRSQKRTLKKCIPVLGTVGIFVVGFGVTFLPFLAFEIRHNFQQIKTIVATLLSSTAVVGQKGFTDMQIIQSFFGVFADLLSVPHVLGFFLLVAGFGIIAFLTVTKKISFSDIERKLLLLIFSIGVIILGIYLSSKNPVWGYHFVGVEMLFVVVLALAAHKITYLRYALLTWIGVLLIQNSISFVNSFSTDYLSFDTLAKKEHIVKTIDSDAGKSEYTVFIYNPGIYTYDFAYLFWWLTKKDVPYDPGQITGGGNIIYLVIPKTSQAVHDDYINYRSPHSQYKTVSTWNIPDGTEVIKRVKNTSDK